MERKEINILQLYNRLSTVSRRLPDYDPSKKGFDMCLMLLKKGLENCPAVNHLVELSRLQRLIQRLELQVDDLKEDNKVLKTKLNKYE